MAGKKITIEEKVEAVIVLNAETIAELGNKITDNTQGTEVGVSIGRTINLGNFEAARLDVHVKTHCDPTDVRPAMEACHKFATANFVKFKAGIKNK